MTSMGESTMTAAEVAQWQASLRKPPKYAGGLQQPNHRWKTLPSVRGRQRTASPDARHAPKAGAAVCVHHWKIAEPDGRVMLPGACKRCGEERMFYAAEPEMTPMEAHRRAMTNDVPRKGGR